MKLAQNHKLLTTQIDKKKVNLPGLDNVYNNLKKNELDIISDSFL